MRYTCQHCGHGFRSSRRDAVVCYQCGHSWAPAVSQGIEWSPLGVVAAIVLGGLALIYVIGPIIQFLAFWLPILGALLVLGFLSGGLSGGRR